MRISIIFLCFLFVCSCQKTVTKTNYRDVPIDSIFKVIDNIDFEKLKNTIIIKRHKYDNLYLLEFIDTQNKCYVYVRANSILEYDSLDCNRYFSNQEIKDIMTEYLRFGFNRILVDSLGNIYVNPYEFESYVFIKQIGDELVYFKNAIHYKHNYYVLDKQIAAMLRNRNNQFGSYGKNKIRIY